MNICQPLGVVEESGFYRTLYFEYNGMNRHSFSWCRFCLCRIIHLIMVFFFNERIGRFGVNNIKIIFYVQKILVISKQD